MSLIIDNNVAHKIVQKAADATPILERLDQRKIILATGGKHLDELLNNSIGRLLKELLRNGRAKNFSGDKLTSSTQAFEKNKSMRSDDPHILALATVSGSRVLYTDDRDLMDDFRDPRLIKNPRGSIYSGANNVRLLRRCK